MTRAFVAIRPPDAVLDAVDRAATSFDVPDARRTTRDQWHVTLQFLGSVADTDAVAGALSAMTAASARLRLGGAGAFPDDRRGRVLWLGLRDGDAAIVAIAAEVQQILAPLGVEPERRDYHAHLTLARANVPRDFRPAVAAIGTDPVGDSWLATEIVLYESRLHRSGAQYVPRATISLRR